MIFINLIIIGIKHYLVHLNHVHNVCVCFCFQKKILIYEYIIILAAFACFCYPCYTAKINDRMGEHFLTCCLNPCSLMALRTKARTAFHIRVNKDSFPCFLLAFFSYL